MTRHQDAQAEAREQQLARLNRERNLEAYRSFKGATARAYIQPKSVRMNTTGDWDFTITIPREQFDDLVAMSQVVGMPITITVTRT